MAWRDVIEARTVSAWESPLESARFGCSIERLIVPTGAEASFSTVRTAVNESDADVIVVRYPAEHVDWFAKLATLGRTAIFADSLAYWRLCAGEGHAPEPSNAIRITGIAGPDAVKALISDIFHAYGNHYLANPLFDPAMALAGYQEWALRSVGQDGCVALSDPDQEDMLGLATLQEIDSRTEILLAGVVSKAQGRGLYAHLLKGVEDRTLARGGREIVISTQGHNMRVQRAWARYGFEPVQALLTVHLVRHQSPHERAH